MLRTALVTLLFLLSGPASRAQVEFVIPIAEDTLLYIDNRGASRILVVLNGWPFKLASDPVEVARSAGAYLIPENGALTIDISAYMVPGEDTNVISFLSQGPPASDFEFVLAPVYVQGQTAPTYRLSGLAPQTDAFRLRAGPNPTRGDATITYEVPSTRITGLNVRLSVFDLRGRRVAALVNDRRFPGSYSVQWDGTASGSPLPSGVYAVRFESDVGVETMLLTLLR